MQKILIVEDDTNINNLLQEALSKEGYSCEQAFSGTEAKLLLNMQDHDYALVLLDLMLPGIPGEAVLEEIRKKGNLPVIVLTAKDSLDEKVEVLTSGADDYITKPFSVVVLHKRIEALQRRIQGRQQNNKWIYKDVEVDFLGFCAKKDNNPVDLKPKEIKLLELLIKHKNQVLTRNQMLDSLWEIDEAPADRVIDVYIKNLRKKLDLDCITTVKGIGYKFEDK